MNEKDIFWADQLAAQAVERATREGALVTCRTAGSPSGTKHIGNLFDVTKSYIVHEAVKKKGAQSRIVFTHDDRDPLRTIPTRLAALDATWVTVDTEMEKALSVYLGFPYCSIPDPLDCCRSWSVHFSKVWEDGVVALGITDMEFYSTDALYDQGKFEPYLVKALQKIDTTRKIIRQFQETKRDDYIPFDALCENCGRIIGRAVSFDIIARTVHYVCEGKSLAGKYAVEGCGHRGVATFNRGKLPWTFEWPAQWGMFSTTFEPFGKEHAEGSWPRGQIIAREIYDFEPPLPHIYEFLLVDGEKMSTRRGNVYITQEILEIIEPEIFLYFYTKRSKKQRNLDLRNIHLLADDFAHAERVYFGKDEEKNETDRANLIRSYESSMHQVPETQPLRIDYQFAAMISQLNPHETAERALQILRATGHVHGTLSAQDREAVETRLLLARRWVEKCAPEKRITVNDHPAAGIKSSLTAEQRHALRELASVLGTQLSADRLSAQLYEIPQKHGLGNKDFFRACYTVLISRDSGPRLAPFILALGEERVRAIFEQV